ncbi:MAG: FAD-dependent oxidoreductase [Enterococcus sp.]
MKVVIVGGSYAGIQVAMSLRESCPDYEILLIEKQEKIGFVPSSYPLFLKGKSAQKNSYWVTKSMIEAQYSIQIKTNTTICKVDTENQKLILLDESTISYDKLILATGSQQQFAQQTKGSLLIKTVKEMNQTDDLNEKIKQAEKIAIVGAGQVGLELAEGLWQVGKQVDIYESQNRMLFRYFDATFTEPLMQEIRRRGVNLFLNEQVEALEEQGEQEKILVSTAQRKETYDLVLLANHTRPAKHVWSEKIKRNDDGTIWVDDYLQTSAKNVYAIGDAIQVTFRPTQEKMYVSSVSNAIRTAKLVSKTISGNPSKDLGTFRPVGNTWFEYFLGSIGLTESESIFYPHEVNITQWTTTVSTIDTTPVRIKCICNEQNQLIGVQIQSKENIFHLFDRFTLAIEEGWTLNQLYSHELFFQPEYRTTDPLCKGGDSKDDA